MNKLTRIMDNRFLLFLLAGLYPAVFRSSKNWFLFSAAPLWVFVLLTPIITLGIGTIGYFSADYALRKATRSTKLSWIGPLRQRILNGGSALFTCAVLFLLFNEAVFEKEFYVIPVLFGVTIVLIILSTWTGLLVLNMMLALMVTMAATDWAVSRVTSQYKFSGAWYTSATEEFQGIQFTRKPNVYAIVMESYQNSDAMSAIYGFDNKPFLDALAEREVIVQPGYSNYWNTVTSLASMLTMNHHYYLPSIGDNDAILLRERIGGQLNNPVLDIFRNNGYKTQFIFDSDYAFHQGDLLDFAYPSKTTRLGKYLRVFDLYHITMLQTALKPWIHDHALHEDEGEGTSTMTNFETAARIRIQTAATSKIPWFTLFKPSATNHTPTYKAWDNLKSWETQYPKLVRDKNPIFLKLIDEIIAADPQAIILMFGDHGALRYRKLNDAQLDLELDTVLEQEGVSGQTLAMDLVGTLIGIRDPGGEAERIMPLSHVNLFRRLFGVLGKEERLLTHEVADESYIPRGKDLYIAVRDGQPLDHWEKFDPDAARKQAQDTNDKTMKIGALP